MDSEATITNVTDKLQKKIQVTMKIHIIEFCIAMVTWCYSHVNLMLHVFSEPNFLVLEANFKILKFKGLSQLTYFI